MTAVLLFHDKGVTPDGFIVGMKIWRLPRADPERPHGLKYSLHFGRDGERLVGYDNERGEGDHRHFRGDERRYQFVTVEKLIADFLADVEAARHAFRESEDWHHGNERSSARGRP
jgi:hypothetical protein